MRIKALFVAAAVGAGLFATAGSASAVICMEVPVVGCVNPCSEVAQAYHAADEAALDLLPNRQFACPR